MKINDKNKKNKKTNSYTIAYVVAGKTQIYYFLIYL